MNHQRKRGRKEELERFETREVHWRLERIPPLPETTPPDHFIDLISHSLKVEGESGVRPADSATFLHYLRQGGGLSNANLITPRPHS